jgi:hypothetical protein
MEKIVFGLPVAECEDHELTGVVFLVFKGVKNKW